MSIETPGEIASKTTSYLTAEQEVELATRIRAGLVNVPRSGRVDVVPGADESTVRAARAARDELVRANFRLVYKAARVVGESSTHGLTFDDLIAEGLAELARCSVSYDPTSGFRFSTYTQPCVERAIKRLVKTSGSPVRLTHRVRAIVDRVYSFSHAEEAQGRVPTWEQKAAVAKMPVEDLRRMWNEKPAGFVVMAAIEGTANEPTSGDDVAAEVDDQQVRASVSDQLSALPSELAEVILLRFGFTTGQPVSLRDCAARLGVSERQIINRERAALLRLRESGRLDGLLCS